MANLMQWCNGTGSSNRPKRSTVSFLTRFPSSKIIADRLDSGFTTEISAWLALAAEGGEIGDDSGSVGGDSSGGSGVVYVDPSIWNETNPVVYCIPPCIIVLPPRALTSTTTITYPPITTTLVEFGGSDDDNPATVSTTITLPPGKFQHPAMFFLMRSL